MRTKSNIEFRRKEFFLVPNVEFYQEMDKSGMEQKTYHVGHHDTYDKSIGYTRKNLNKEFRLVLGSSLCAWTMKDGQVDSHHFTLVLI